MKAAFYTLGCKVNQYETQIMTQTLMDDGFEIVSPDSFADVYIVNSCTVTAESDHKTRQILRRLKSNNPEAIAVLCGCFPQSAPEKAKAITEADVICGSREKSLILNLVKQALESKKRVISIAPYNEKESYNTILAEGFEGHTRAFIKIEDGCESYCTYCIIPYARGPVRSKSPEDIKKEVSLLASKGFKEVVLVGINLTSYGRDCNLKLEDAIRAACDTDIKRVRLGSLEPNIITKEFIDCVKSLEQFCPQFHLALQSGCKETLKRMNRHYTPDHFRDAVNAIRNAIPFAGITTDIIVGFPGESEEEFKASLDFVREIKFSQGHVFPYSRRVGTPAEKMPNQISKAEKSIRCHKMIDVCSQTKAEFLKSQIGRIVPVLFETVENGVYDGFAPDYAQVKVESEKDLKGEIYNVKLTGYVDGYCTGSLMS